ncbi:MAG: hypothetical protein M3N49_15660, partial [Candidatus Eremiobacteraeota bacterium]|nr:hypothetical protein [Candidatus Eremiobacteraeota bacterium]
MSFGRRKAAVLFRRLVVRRGGGIAQMECERADRRMIEQVEERDGAPCVSFDRRLQSAEKQRMPAGVEKIIVDADGASVQHVAPRVAEASLEVSRRMCDRRSGFGPW